MPCVGGTVVLCNATVVAVACAVAAVATVAAVNGAGATHLCDVVACQLPEAGWWEQGGNSSHRGGSSSRGLNRSNSSRGRSRSIQQAAEGLDTPAAAAAAADLQAECQIE